MEAAMSKSRPLRKWPLKLAELFPMFRRPDLEQELTEARTRIGWQKKRTERLQQRYDATDRRCVALTNEIDGLRSRLYAAQQQAEAFKGMVKTFCASIETVEELKRLYEAVAPTLDNGGFNLFYAAQEITGFCLHREFPHEDACGCFEFLDGFELLRYLKASEFNAVDWEPVPGTDCKKANLREVDESTPAYQEFERQLYMRTLERLGLCTFTSEKRDAPAMPPWLPPCTEPIPATAPVKWPGG